MRVPKEQLMCRDDERTPQSSARTVEVFVSVAVNEKRVPECEAQFTGSEEVVKNSSPIYTRQTHSLANCISKSD